VISSSQRPLPGNTQHSQQTNNHAPAGIRTHDLSRGAAATYALDRAATGTGQTLGRILETKQKSLIAFRYIERYCFKVKVGKSLFPITPYYFTVIYALTFLINFFL